MLSEECRRELHENWFPNLTDSGLERLIELLRTDSPYLLRGDWTSHLVVGCLATHVGWHHPVTTRFGIEAGGIWLSQVAGVDPAHSHVLREWDHYVGTANDRSLKSDFLAEFREEKRRRLGGDAECEVNLAHCYAADLKFFEKFS